MNKLGLDFNGSLNKVFEAIRIHDAIKKSSRYTALGDPAFLIDAISGRAATRCDVQRTPYVKAVAGWADDRPCPRQEYDPRANCYGSKIRRLPEVTTTMMMKMTRSLGQ
ncbi:uncharacterized protein CIMG_08967 [Coccidioides immitis RS]|uniref:Uncharacterized protein n=3 Tax=Coccidioides immitis TaxID=5501 RepID=J3K1C3_COCIM|nr:uncharacterized protein CIMG_08967 [Coccidioides immitis RS]EAS27763.3 hypothetical protein CIMG_08967 [Coccidioides immitis RS]KMP08545.1 hypothetical protein CIRG_08226 [Coccidioides immitis RMSCC 2394]KMU87361.1 hypothetical protein CIHG_05153 [Coccidioides immitis H538.4]